MPWSSALVGAFLLLACQTPVESVFLPDDESWKAIHAADDGHQTIVEFVGPAETLENWREMCTIQMLDDRRSWGTPREVMQQLEASMRGRCPEVRWSVVEELVDRIVYEWQIQGCAGQPDQGEVAMLLRGKDGMHRTAYSHRYLPLPPERHSHWLDVLRRARPVKGEDEARRAVAEFSARP